MVSLSMDQSKSAGSLSSLYLKSPSLLPPFALIIASTTLVDSLSLDIDRLDKVQRQTDEAVMA